jgi:hypothetical protein
MRAADADRQATVDALAAHFTAGRLTAAEYDERVQHAYAATYLDELPALLADLPDETGWGAGGRRAGESGPHYWGGDGADDGRTAAWSEPGPWRGNRGGWAGAPTYRHRRPVLLPAILVLALLAVLTHGFVFIPLLWVGLAVLVFGRHRHGGCGRRFGPRSAR